MRAQRSLPRPPWFESAIGAVLHDFRARVITSPRLRDLEQTVSELLGEQLGRAIDTGTGDMETVADRWFVELFMAAVHAAAQDQDDAAAAWLAGGLLMVAAGAEMERLIDEMWCEPGGSSTVSPVPTGDVWRLNDYFGTRLGVVAEFIYPGDAEPHAYLLDIDACGWAEVVGGGVYDTVREASDAWRAAVGADAAQARPYRVVDAADLVCLRCCDFSGLNSGSATGSREYYRARRRTAEIRLWWHDQPFGSIHADMREVIGLQEEFQRWFADRFGHEPDFAALSHMVWGWAEQALPDTLTSVSVHRVTIHRDLLMVDSHPAVRRGVELLPDWVRFLGERADLPESALTPILAAAELGSELPARIAPSPPRRGLPR